MHTGVETILILILRGWVWEGESPSCTLRKYLHNPAQNAIIVIPILIQTVSKEDYIVVVYVCWYKLPCMQVFTFY